FLPRAGGTFGALSAGFHPIEENTMGILGSFSPSVRRLLAAFVVTSAGFLGFPAVFSGIASAANGDVLSVSSVLFWTDLSDIALDSGPVPNGGTFWVLGRLNGKIYHLSADLTKKLGELTNPHGTGTQVKPILSWGIAYRASTKSVFVVAQDGPTWKVRE